MVIILHGLIMSMIRDFLIAFGVVVGASVFSGFSALLTNHPPMKAMMDMASSTKIWAMAIALGDTFSSFEVIEKGLFKGEFKSIIRQAIYVLTALLGANMGYGFIRLIQRCSKIWES